MLRHDKEYYIKFVLFFTLVFFVLTYVSVNWETMDSQLDVIASATSFFAQTTINHLVVSQELPGVNSETYQMETLIHEQINEIRAENDLKPLEWDPFLGKLARGHALDMANLGYLNHTNLFGQSPTDRAEDLGIRTKIYFNKTIYTGVGENIGFMPKGVVQDTGVILTTNDVASAMVFQWLLSEPHKENILTPDYFFTGIGVVYDGRGNYYIVQNFQ